MPLAERLYTRSGVRQGECKKRRVETGPTRRARSMADLDRLRFHWPKSAVLLPHATAHWPKSAAAVGKTAALWPNSVASLGKTVAPWPTCVSALGKNCGPLPKSVALLGSGVKDLGHGRTHLGPDAALLGPYSPYGSAIDARSHFLSRPVPVLSGPSRCAEGAR
jgi:hypothetical protein